MTKRTHSERYRFERWLAQWDSVDRTYIRERRSEFGYEDSAYDMAWAAWQSAGKRTAQRRS